MKIQTVVLAIATVLTLSQSAQANECKIFELVRHRGVEAVTTLRRTVVKQVLDGHDVPDLVEKIKRYDAVIAYNEMYRKRVGCESYNLKESKITRAERAVAEETIIKLDYMLHD